MNESIRVINSVELIPLESTEVNPYLTKVRIKVFHLGENRNQSYIDKPTAIKMAATLRGNPIVARYREEDKDFTDHGHEITIDDKGIHEKILTRPYGFVDLNADVWFEDYNDTDEFGKVVTHTYVVTNGYIWTEYYEELKNTIMDGGRPQSMELDEKTIQGDWSTKINPKYEIFIINDAIITKLCALGENTEPCFIGSSITPLFSQMNEESFVKELIDFKTKFSLALNNNKGGNDSMNENEKNGTTQASVEPTVGQSTAPAENFSNDAGKNAQTVSSEIQNNVGEFVKDKKDDEKDTDKNNSSNDDKKNDTSDKDNETTNEDDDKKKKASTEHSLEEKYQLLETQFNELKDKYTSLEQQNQELVAFKLNVEDKEKDALIAKFFMLSDEDKKNVIENKSKYSLDDIEKELSVICVRKKVNFTTEDNSAKTEPEAPTIYNLNSTQVDPLPAWLRAVENHSKQNN